MTTAAGTPWRNTDAVGPKRATITPNSEAYERVTARRDSPNGGLAAILAANGWPPNDTKKATD